MKNIFFWGGAVIIAAAFLLNSCSEIQSPENVERLIIFEPDGGDPAPEAQKIVIGSKIIEPEPMTKAGHQFDKWYSDKNCTREWDFISDRVIANITLYAKWNPEKAAVTFVANGGAPVPDELELSYGDAIPQPPPMTKTGYGFAGWFLDETLVEEWDFVNGTVTASITLYAGWDDTAFSVTFNPNGAQQSPPVQEIALGAKVVPCEVTKTGYILEGWYSDDVFTELWDFYTDTVSEDLILYAKWSPITYTVNFRSNNSKNVVYLEERIYDSGAPLGGGSLFTYQYFTFAGWNTQSNGGGDSYGAADIVNLTAVHEAVVDLFAQWDAGEDATSAFVEYLEEQYAAGVGTDINNPIPLALSVELDADNWDIIQTTISELSGGPTAPAFVDLDLSNSTSTTGIFDGSTNYAACNNIRSIILPDSVETISANSFFSTGLTVYWYLKTVSGSGVKTIGDNAFLSCWSLETADFPNVETIGANAFDGCQSLQDANFSNVVTIGRSAFNGCNNLQSVSFPNATEVGEKAFKSCSYLLNVSIPNVTEIGAQTFLSCVRLQSVYIPNVTNIGTQAFRYCSVLGTVTLRAGATISSDAFENCPNNLLLIEIPPGGS